MTPPQRFCNGGPTGPAWCGTPATHVATNTDGLAWFCCPKHSEGAALVPVSVFFATVDETVRAAIAADLLSPKP